MAIPIITYQVFYNPVVANLVKAKLDDNGIACFLTDENLAYLVGGFNPMVGGVKLKIFESDQERVREILNHNGEENLDLIFTEFPLN